MATEVSHQTAEFGDRQAAGEGVGCEGVPEAYRPRWAIPAASSAGYHSRVRQVSSPMWPPFGVGKTSASPIGVVDSDSSASHARAVSGTRRRERSVFG
jgi:hypothetical protein